MELTILGSGCSFPDPKRRATAFVIIDGNSTILLDAGEGATTAMEAYGIDWAKLDAICITHYHNDHVAGLVPLLFALHIYSKRENPLSIYGPEGLDQYFKAQKEALADWLGETPFELKRKTIDDKDAFSVGTIEVQCFAVAHSKKTLGYRLSSGGKVIAFSGDTRMDPVLFELSADADIFVCEAGYPDGAPNPNHLTWTEIGQVAGQCGVGKVVLTHFHGEINERAIRNAIARNYSGEVLLSEDGMVLRASAR